MLAELRIMDESVFRTKTVEKMKQNARIAKGLFPGLAKDASTFGEIIFLVRFGQILGSSEPEIEAAGLWWLWAKTLFIKNTMTRPQQELMQIIALRAAKTGGFIHFVSARSPEWIHAQVSSQGEGNLPRSRTALKTLSEIAAKSAQFLPTRTTVLLADVAIDNLRAILKVNPSLEKLAQENLLKLEEIITTEGMPNVRLLRLSQLAHPSGKSIGELVEPDGLVKTPFNFSPQAEEKILIATRESIESQKRMFGWDEEQATEHNRNIAATMALVGQAVKIMQPPAILIHNESFISRGALNNLLNDPKDPLPVICLNTLLERKITLPEMVK